MRHLWMVCMYRLIWDIQLQHPLNQANYVILAYLRMLPFVYTFKSMVVINGGNILSFNQSCFNQWIGSNEALFHLRLMFSSKVGTLFHISVSQC